MFWILAATLTLGSLAALYYAASFARVNAAEGNDEAAVTAHFRSRLAEIDEAVAAERLTGSEADAARAELARELVRQKKDGPKPQVAEDGSVRNLRIAAVVFVAVFSFALYYSIGRPDLPAMPLASREQPQLADLDMDEAVRRVEAALRDNPEDARGWEAIGPVYMQLGRYEDAANAFRQLIELSPVTPDMETDLAEALMMTQGGSAEGEPLELLESAAARDPGHIRSRFYLAGEATRAGDYEIAITRWQSLLALGNGDEPWADVARSGLAAAEAGLRGEPLPAAPDVAQPDPDQEQMIRGMVEGLSERLFAEGGSVDEWTRLVRSRLVLGETELAQQAYDAAKAAHPEAVDRADLDTLALSAGLE